MTQPYEDLALDHHLMPDDLDIPEPDFLEQEMIANPTDDPAEPHYGLEVSPWDAQQQAEIVNLDDDYAP